MTAPVYIGSLLHDWAESAATGKSVCVKCGVTYNGENGREMCAVQEKAERKAAFNSAVDEVLGQAIAISNQRGGEYADSWALENQQTRFLDMVMREIEHKANKQDRGPWTQFSELGTDEKRLIMVASLCDVKMSRMIGGFKGDTLDDLINYVAALRKWLGDYVMSHGLETSQAED